MIDTTTTTGAEPKTGPSVLKERDGIRDAIAALIGLGRREILIFAPQLEAYFFNSSAVSRSLASFAARHQYNRARILIEDSAQVLRDNDRIVGLCRRFAEFIPLRQVGEEHRGRREMFIVIDNAACLHQADITEPNCVVDPEGRQRAIELRRQFNAMWDRSEPTEGLSVAGLSA